MSVVSAVDLSDACSSRGFTSTLSTWTYNGTYIEVSGSDVDVIGNARKANWTSDVNVSGVVYKSGTRTYLLDGGYFGVVPKTTVSNDIQFIAFCTNDVQVPEFGTIGAGLAVIGVIGLVVYRRKK